MDQHISLDFINRTVFEREDVVKYYREVENLLPAEKVIFERLLPSLRDASILDIGVGGGRTTPYLLEVTRQYTGIDYVKEFAEKTARKFPEATILCMDATDLSEFEDERFDFVIFSYNGLDCLSHDARMKALSETRRVLKSGGTFMFSSHNRDYKYFHKLPWQQKIHLNRGYLTFMLHCLYHLPTHYKMKHLEVFTEDYAIINDGDHRFSLLLYYISIDKQRQQLLQVGFSDVEAYDIEGSPVDRDSGSHWLHYLARKA